MIPVYIPSKNRACQVDLLLRSFDVNCPGMFAPVVVYTFSNENFKSGYDLLLNKWSNKVQFILEGHPATNFYDFLRSNEIVGLFADDCIFYRPNTIKEELVYNCLSYNDVMCFSFRLGQNVTINDYIKQQSAKFPENMYMIENDNILLWDYRKNFKNPWESNWAFELGFDGCFYRSEDLLWLSEEKDFGPIFLYEGLVTKNGRRDLHSKYYMTCPLQSNVVCQQINSTHGWGLTNRGYQRSLEELNNSYLAGYRISLDSMDFSQVRSCHDEIPFSLEIDK